MSASAEVASWTSRLDELRRRCVLGRGPGPTAVRAGLRAASWLYGLGARAKNAPFDAGLRRGAQVAAHVVSVGNLSAGGTGKTPIVALLARAARAAGRDVAVLTRGYRRRGTRLAEGDEVTLLRRLLPGLEVVVDPDRVRGAATCVARGADLILLDDGFQHRRLRRDVDVVLLDARDPFQGGLLPLGLLREPRSGLRRATVAVLTRSGRAGPRGVAAARAAIAAIAPDLPVLTEDHAPVGVVDVEGVEHPLGALREGPVVAFSGIGDPRTLVESLEELGVDVRAHLHFGDHHEYTSADRERLRARAREVGARALVTTEKDLVRLDPAAGEDRATPWWALRIEARLGGAADAQALGAAVGFPVPQRAG